MKRLILAAVMVALSNTAADAGPLRNLVCRIRCGDGPARRTVRYVVQERPVATVAANTLYATANVIQSRPVANFVQTCVNGQCRPSFAGAAK